MSVLTTTTVLLYLLGFSALTISCNKNAEQETDGRAYPAQLEIHFAPG